jgi:hypothetical protein
MSSLKTFELAVLSFVTIGLIIFVGLRIMSELYTQEQDTNNNSDVLTALDNVIAGISQFPIWLVVVAVVIVGAFLIGYLKKNFSTNA